MPGPAERVLSCPEWTSAGEKRTTASVRTTTGAAEEILRLNWTVCLRNGDLNKSRFSHGLTDKFSKPLFISFGSRRLVNYFAAFGAMASRFSTRRARAPCGLRGVMRP